MARKSQRLSAGATTALPSHKRNASNTSLPGGEAKKTRTQKATPTKSQYFSKGEQNDAHSGSQDDDDASAPEDDGDDDPASAAEEDLSEFGSAPESDDAEDDEDDEEEYESEVEQPKSRRKSASAKIMAASSKKKSGGELWREGVKTGLGPGQEVIIKKPKARPAGKVPYSDETIHPNTILFLKDLKENNNREWLKSELFLLRLVIIDMHVLLWSRAYLVERQVYTRCALSRLTDTTQACHNHTSRYNTTVKTRLCCLPNTVQQCAAESLPLQQQTDQNTQCTIPTSAKARRTGFHLWKS